MPAPNDAYILLFDGQVQHLHIQHLQNTTYTGENDHLPLNRQMQLRCHIRLPQKRQL